MNDLIRKAVTLIFFAILCFGSMAREYPVSSPNGKIEVKITVDNTITWSANMSSQPVFGQNTMSMDLGHRFRF